MKEKDYIVIENIINCLNSYNALVEESNKINNRLQNNSEYNSKNTLRLEQHISKKDINMDIWINSKGIVPNEVDYQNEKVLYVDSFFDSQFWNISFVAVIFFVILLGISFLCRELLGTTNWIKLGLGLLIAYLLFETTFIANRLLAYYAYKQQRLDDRNIIDNNKRQYQKREEIIKYNLGVDRENSAIDARNEKATSIYQGKEERDKANFHQTRSKILNELSVCKAKIAAVKSDYQKYYSSIGASPLIFSDNIEKVNVSLWLFAYRLCKDNYAKFSHDFGKVQDYLLELGTALYFESRREKKLDQVQNNIIGEFRSMKSDIIGEVRSVKNDIYDHIDSRYDDINSQLIEVGKRINKDEEQ